jgi:lipopolysaccharide/colanic/teichoic acid biosynthesis glycosyltransferase
MNRSLLLGVDILLMLAATAFAIALRENFELFDERIFAYLPFIGATAISSVLLFWVARINRTVWRFSGLPDYFRVAAAIIAASLSGVALTFVYNRLDGVARSLPVLQILSGIAFLTAARSFHKLSHSVRQKRKTLASLFATPQAAAARNVLIAGVSFLTETYLKAAEELYPGSVTIAGLLGRRDRDVGRLVAAHPILGTPEDVEQILDALEVHGMNIDRIVIAVPFERFSQDARAALIKMEQTRGLELQFLAEDLGFEPNRRRAAEARTATEAASDGGLRFEISPTELCDLAARRYWAAKRACDAVAALILLILLSPLLLLSSAAVAASLGFPVFFWQQRPGLGSIPFRLYKLRTMKPGRGPDGRLLPDCERTSRVGTLLRRVRLDELPQLFNILRGDMSFVGPRPLLSKDQPSALRTRLLVRPGLTGWAQVVGGRDISTEDKAALDVWYVRNACLALDLEIALRTVPVVLFGERVSRSLIERAWSELRDRGVLKDIGALKGEALGSSPILPAAGHV